MVYIILFIERNQAVDHQQESKVLEVEIAKLQTRLEDLSYEKRLVMHQVEMYEKFITSKVLPAFPGEVLTGLIGGHYLCATESGLKWVRTPHVPKVKDVSISLLNQIFIYIF